MIIWIASYPKSGNTWVRSLLSSYLYSQDGTFNFSLLQKIKQFPTKQFFDYFLNDFSDIKKVSDYWIPAQDRINLSDQDITLMKTHNALCTLENNSFTNKNNTKAVIYVVRDPRNLITSVSHHYSIDLSKAYDFITNKNKMLTESEYGDKAFGVATVLGSWSDHYISWKNIKFAPILIIKYEDLLKDTKKTFIKILNFLSQFTKIDHNDKKISKTVESCSFDRLVKKEKIEGFNESINLKDGKGKINFFYLGSKNDWRVLLDKNLQKKVTSTFSNDMKELDYI